MSQQTPPVIWQERAQAAARRAIYPCTERDRYCHYQEPHKHGAACDWTCLCKDENRIRWEKDN